MMRYQQSGSLLGIRPLGSDYGYVKAVMAKPTISSYLKDNVDEATGKKKQPGPYVTISRQWGCDGVELGQMLADKLNERYEEQPWKFYHKDILKQIAEDTGHSQEVLEKERLAKPSLVKDFLRGLKRQGIPDGFEIRNQITQLVREVAFGGHAVILGQGATAATGDLANGLSMRVVAPKEWRIARICIRENLDKRTATARIDEIEEQRDRLRGFYERQNPRNPAFHLVFDNSVFTNEQIIELVLFAMEGRKLIPPLEDSAKKT
jgi:hypothetical protein